jgi:hypothetical protein
MRIHIYILLIVLLGVTSLEAQIGINTNNPDPSAILEIKGNNGGLLIPRGTFNQRMNIPVSKPGLLFYDVSLDRMMMTRAWNDTMLWMPIGPIWQENANALFIDTPFLKKVGIGTSTPEALLHVAGKSVFNDTMLLSGHLRANDVFVPGRTYTDKLNVEEKAIFNDTMLVSGLLKANDMEVNGTTQWNDTMMVLGHLQAEDLQVNGTSKWNDTMLVSGFFKVNEMELAGNGLINDTLFVHQMNAEQMQVSGKALFNDTLFVNKMRALDLTVFGNGIFNDTIFAGFQEVSGLNVEGVSIFNDTILAKNLKISDDLVINGPTQWNDTMLVTGYLKVNEMEVFGPTRWNDTMMVAGFLRANEMEVEGPTLWNDTMLVAGFFKANEMEVEGPTQWNDTMLVQGYLDADEMNVNGKAIFNDTMLVSKMQATNLNVSGSAVFSSLEGNTPKPLYADPNGKLTAWNDTMMVAFSALNCKSNFPINTQFDANQITAGLTTDQSGSAMWLPLEFPRNGQLLDSLFVTFLDASPMNMTFSMMEMKSDGSGMQAIETVTTTGNMPGTIRTVAIDFDNDSETIDPTSIYLLRVTSTNWSSGTQRILGGYLRLVGS